MKLKIKMLLYEVEAQTRQYYTYRSSFREMLDQLCIFVSEQKFQLIFIRQSQANKPNQTFCIVQVAFLML